jgi:hypothetical protein
VGAVKVSELPVIALALENSSSAATIRITRGNNLVYFTQTTTFYSGVQFVNMTQIISSNIPTVSVAGLNITVQTKGKLTTGNNLYIAIVDSERQMAGQLIFNGPPPAATQVTDGTELLFGLNSSKSELNFYVSVFPFSTEASLNSLFEDNTAKYTQKTAETSLDVFNYRQALNTLGVSYITIRDPAQNARFAQDPLFRQVFVNKEVTIYQVKTLP